MSTIAPDEARRRRIDADISMTEMAERIGVDRAVLWRWEKNDGRRHHRTTDDRYDRWLTLAAELPESWDSFCGRMSARAEAILAGGLVTPIYDQIHRPNRDAGARQ